MTKVEIVLVVVMVGQAFRSHIYEVETGGQLLWEKVTVRSKA